MSKEIVTLCFAPCSKDKIDSGLCNCINMINNSKMKKEHKFSQEDWDMEIVNNDFVLKKKKNLKI